VLTNLVVTESQYWYVDVTAPPSTHRFYQVVFPPVITFKQLITNISMVPRLTIQSPVGIINQIHYSTNLSQTNWVVLTNLAVTEKQYWYVDVTAPLAPQRFYQVVVPTVITLKQLWGSAGRTNSATNLIQRTSIPTPVNTAAAAFDATHSSIWIPVSYIPAWGIGTVVYWGSAPYSMRVSALGSDQIQFSAVSGGYFGWSAGMPIVTSFGYSLSSVVTAASAWITPGVGNTVQITASAVTGSVGDVVWVGGVGANQFQIISIVR
jgi:hypothetical protein